MARNVELRQRVSGSFDHADSLLYPKTHINMVQGLLDELGKLNLSIIPESLLGSNKSIGSYTFAPGSKNTAAFISDNTTVLLEQIAGDTPSAPKAWADVIKALRGVHFTMGANDTITLSTGHTASPGDDGVSSVASGQTITLEINDIVMINSITGGTGTTNAQKLASASIIFGIINNTHGLATTSNSGLMSSGDKTKLDGIALNANNYSHPAYTARNIDTDGINVLDTFTSDATGHVTGIATRALPAATGSTPGVMSAVDKSKLDGIEMNANNYSHDTNGANTTISAAANETIAGVTVNNLGHVTAISKQTIRTGSTSQTGILQLSTGTELTTALSTTKALTPTAVKTMIDYFAGIPRYADLATANAASHPDGSIVLVTVA